jgi:hypothetical protein
LTRHQYLARGNGAEHDACYRAFTSEWQPHQQIEDTAIATCCSGHAEHYLRSEVNASWRGPVALSSHAMPLSDEQATWCRAVLAASGASLLLLFSASSAQAVNLNEAKRRRDRARLLPA